MEGLTNHFECNHTDTLFSIRVQILMNVPWELISVLRMLSALTPMEATLAHVNLDTVAMDLLAQVS